MKNEKKNPFLCNVGLFSLSYFLHRIQDDKSFKNKDHADVIACYQNLKDVWEKNEKLLTNSKINESDTEKLFVDKVIDSLGYAKLSKSALSSGKKNKLFPDYALFEKTEDANMALNADEEFKFKGAIGIIEGKKFNLKLNDIDHDDDDHRLPAVQLIDYLQKTEVDWGFLTNGKYWQIYHRRGQYNVSRFFEVDLTDLLNHPKPSHEFAIFYHLFHVSSLQRSKNENRLDSILDISKRYTQDVGLPFYDGCDKALRLIFENYQKLLKAKTNHATSLQCHQASIILLFRIIAIRYLEDRGVLPVRDNNYRNLSLDRMRLHIENTLKIGGVFSKKSTDLWQKIRLLFKDVNNGTFGIYVGHKGLESDLFEIDFDTFFRDHPITDDVLSTVIDSICRGTGKIVGQIDFYDLGVEKIGDVYNQLLALRLVNKEKNWELTYSESVKKELGSYFTHPSLTNLLSGSVIEYLHKEFPDDSTWLNLKICDNSCGSGHFLRQMVEDISYELYISKGNTTKSETQKVLDQNAFRRMLAQHCIYGIDKDVNAVWLTKLSLWLHTAENGKPFVFLDHHVVQGDSILSTVEAPRLEDSVYKEINEIIKKMNVRHSEDREDLKISENLWLRLKTIAKRHVKLKEAQPSLLKTDKSVRETYFSYALTFPDVFLNERESLKGFNIIVGNPPWETVEPKLPEFFKIETGDAKSLKRKDLDAWLDKDTGRKKKYENYKKSINQYADAIRGSGYKLQAKKVYTYSYFTERSLQTLAVNGLLCYVVKLGLYGDENAKTLRGNLFKDNYLEKMWIVKKNKLKDIKFFAQIDHNEKFLVFTSRKVGLRNISSPLEYKVKAKEITSIADVNHNFENWQEYDLPKSLDTSNKVIVYDSKLRQKISNKISKFMNIRECGYKVTTELNMTTHRHLFTTSTTDLPIFTGKELNSYTLKKPEKFCKNKETKKNYPTVNLEKIVTNDILPNSRRKLKASEVPVGVLTAETLLVITGFQTDIDKKVCLASLNSLLVDYYLRPYISNLNLNNFRLYNLPVFLQIPNELKIEISQCVKAIQKKKDFQETCDEYIKIEGIISACVGLTNQEIRSYINDKNFTDFKKDHVDISNDVIDYAKIYREEYDLTSDMILDDIFAVQNPESEINNRKSKKKIN